MASANQIRLRLLLCLTLMGCRDRALSPSPIPNFSAPLVPVRSLADWSQRIGAGCDEPVNYQWLDAGELLLTCGSQLELLEGKRLERIGSWIVPTRKRVQRVEQGANGSLLVLTWSNQLWSVSKKELQGNPSDQSRLRVGTVNMLQRSESGAIAISDDRGVLSVLSPTDGKEAAISDNHHYSTWVLPDTLAYCTYRQEAEDLPRDSAGRMPSLRAELFVWKLGDKRPRSLGTADYCYDIYLLADGLRVSMGTSSWHLRTGARAPYKMNFAIGSSRGGSGSQEDCYPMNWPSGVALPDGSVIRRLSVGFGVERIGAITATPLWTTKSIEPLSNLKLSPAGDRLVARCGPEAVCAWDTESGTALSIGARTISRSAQVLLLSGSANGSILLSGSRNSNVVAWDLERGTMAVLEGALSRSDHQSGRCDHEAVFSGNVAVAPSGEATVLTSHAKSHMFHRSHGTWSELPQTRDGAYVGSRFVFPYRNSWFVVDRADAALRHAVPLPKSERSGAGPIVTSANQQRFAIATTLALEVRSGGEPFGEVLRSLPVGRPLAISPQGDCVLGTGGHWCEDTGLRQWEDAQAAPAFFQDHQSILVYANATQHGTLSRSTLWSNDSGWGWRPKPITNSEEDWSDLGYWQVGAAAVHTVPALMFVWNREWLVRVSHAGSLLFERAPGEGIILELVPLSDWNAAYVLSNDGRYDVIGPDAAEAERELACFPGEGPPSLAACGAVREPGLLALRLARHASGTVAHGFGSTLQSDVK